MKKQLPVLLVTISVLFIVLMVPFKSDPPKALPDRGASVPPGVCPPYYLLTDEGDTINPVTGLNADQPYSPRQTCGKCHDYEKITQGFHFQQGKNEKPDPGMAELAQWVSSPGNYGGPWCSPHPLYSYLSPKRNESEKTIDMTSYSFVKSCGVCHPGGGPLEFDRSGLRYDIAMADTANQWSDGGINNLDGDYYKARWMASGVIEADCFLCHLPNYNFKERTKQIERLNYRWAGTSAAGLARADGSVADNEEVVLTYNTAMFNNKGQFEPNVVRSPRNEACLNCHSKPGWKKRGANFEPHTDVHIRAGLRCVDCHPAGRSATHDLIKGKEEHQFGKGDDPSGFVRNDLDNTMRACNDCHLTGYMGAPVTKHAWLPPLHLQKISCQACHIPQRNVKAAHYAASDVFNPGARIPTLKQIWTFYGPDVKYWNHYGELAMMQYDDKPVDPFYPELIRYKGIIYPANRVHTSWPGILDDSLDGLMQPRMAHFHAMWSQFRANPGSYPQLKEITDDNGDQVDEINRPEEIDALIAALTSYLEDIKYPLKGKRVVWVYNNRIYSSGSDYQYISKETWQASPYGNVHTFNHDILPAKGALGSGGCTDCHSKQSGFFTRAVLDIPFDENAQPVTEPQYKILGLTALQVYTGLFRETYLKPVLYMLLVILVAVVLARSIRKYLQRKNADTIYQKWFPILTGSGLVALFVWIVFISSDLSIYMIPSRNYLDANHFMVGVGILAGTILILGVCLQPASLDHRSILALIRSDFTVGFYVASILILIVSGIGMLIGLSWVFYTLFDLSLAACLISVIIKAWRS